MLNQVTVDHIQTVHQKRQSGTLWVAGAGFRMRLCFQDGNPVAIDLGRDKEALLADTFLEYHKIQPELHRMLGDVLASAKGGEHHSPVTEFIRQQQAASDEEITQILQAMVEEALVRILTGEVKTIHFSPGEGIEAFDFEHSSLRMRLDTKVLLSTVGARVAEDDATRTAIGTGASIFMLAEVEHPSANLTVWDKGVLEWIDGQRTVDDIATGLREHTIQVGHVLRQLAAKGIIRRQASTSTRARFSFEQTRPSAEPSTAARGTAPAAVPVAPPRPARRSRPLLVISLIFILFLAAGVWYLVKESKERESAIERLNADVRSAIASRNWDGSRTLVSEAEQKAGSDVVAKERIKKLQAEIQTALAKETEEIRKAIAADDFAIKTRIDSLPAELASALQGELAAEKERFGKRSDSLANQADQALAHDGHAEVAALIAANPGAVSGEAAKRLENWRTSRLGQAAAAGPLARRSAAMALVKASNPRPHEKQRLTDIEQDINRLYNRTADDFRRLRTDADAGAWKSVLDETSQSGLADLVKGTTFDNDLAALRKRCDGVRDELAAYLDGLPEVVANGSAKPLADRLAAGEKLSATYPKAANAAEITGSVDVLRRLGEILGKATAADQVNAIDLWLKDAKLGEVLTAAVTRRRDELKGLEASAQANLESARRLVVQNDLDGAFKALEAFLSRPEIRITSSRAAAEQLIAEVKAQLDARSRKNTDLEAALKAGDIAKARALAAELGQKDLPLQVDSTPAGAEIHRDGKLIGRTPLVLRLSAGERNETVFEIRLNGYVPKRLQGSKAEDGWRLRAALERSPSASTDLKTALSAKPAVVDERVWLAGNSLIASVGVDGQVVRFALDSAGGALSQPVYAAAAKLSDGVYFSTRNGFALRLAANQTQPERVALGAQSDLAPVLYRSPLVIDRNYLIAAGTDGILRAVNLAKPLDTWVATAGDPLACAPVLLGESLRLVRRNGRLEALSADDGRIQARADLGQAVVAAWATPKGLAGYSANTLWTWEDEKPEREELPATPAVGGPTAFISSGGRAFIRNRGDAAKPWIEAEPGRVLDAKPTGEPVAWNGHVAVATGTSVKVVGPQPFSCETDADMLDPVVLNGHLVIIATNGRVWIYKP